MHRSPHTLTGLFIVLGLVLITIRLRLVDAVLYFLLAGIIPGTSYALSPTVMLILVSVALWVILIRLSRIARTALYSPRPPHGTTAPSRGLPHRRYTMRKSYSEAN